MRSSLSWLMLTAAVAISALPLKADDVASETTLELPDLAPRADVVPSVEVERDPRDETVQGEAELPKISARDETAQEGVQVPNTSPGEEDAKSVQGNVSPRWNNGGGCTGGNCGHQQYGHQQYGHQQYGHQQYGHQQYGHGGCTGGHCGQQGHQTSYTYQNCPGGNCHKYFQGSQYKEDVNKYHDNLAKHAAGNCGTGCHNSINSFQSKNSIHHVNPQGYGYGNGHGSVQSYGHQGYSGGGHHY